jgi:hypothetical protein
MQHSSILNLIQNRCKQNCLETQLLPHSSNSWKINVV